MKSYICMIVFVAGLNVTQAWADEVHHAGGTPHFAHPLVAESPTPDTKIRVDYRYQNAPGEDGEPGARISTMNIEGEYALDESVGVEIGIPYSMRDSKGDEGSASHLDNIEVALKYANFSLADHGLLLGGGVEVGLPTGSTRKGIGSSHVVEIEPFIDFGYQFDRFEAVGFLKFGFPFNEHTDDKTDLELGWNLSLLHKTTDGLQLLIEADGESVRGGGEDGHNVVNLTPGIKYWMPHRPNLSFGAGVSFPVSDDKEFYAMPFASVLYHF